MADLRKAAAVVAGAIIAMSPLALLDMKKHEGTGPTIKTAEGVRYKAYPDPYLGWGKATICYGHTKGVKQGMTATQAQCDAWFKEDVARHCALIKPWPKTQGELDAYCSFAYNTGRFEGTNAVHGRYIKDDRWGACMGLLQYYYSGGKPSRGLWERRYAEYNLCISELPVNTKGRR